MRTLRGIFTQMIVTLLMPALLIGSACKKNAEV